MHQILIVDDEPKALKYFRQLFSDCFKVVTAPDASRALKILETDADKISVVVSDQRMPGIPGVELLAKIYQRWPSISRILTTAYADLESVQLSVNAARVYGYVPKPWNIDELRRLINEAANTAATTRGSSQYLPTLLGAFAHELASPLLSVELGAEQLAWHYACGAGVPTLDPAEGGESHPSNLALQILSDARQARSILGMLARVACDTTDTEALSSCSAARAVVHTLEDYKFAFAERNKISLDLRRDFTILGKYDAISCILRNLIANALDSCRHFEGSEILVSLSVDGSCGRIRVADNGNGFNPAVRAKVFKSVVTSKQNGRGLGLLICQILMNRMGGAIDIAEDAALGTALDLSFPIPNSTN